MTKVPPELEGLTFLQTACGDADATSGITVNLTLKYPSTVYFIDDARAANLPTWARGKWKLTPLTIEGTDPKLMRVYQADLPAGPLTLGTSRDGIDVGKGNYIVAVRPKLIAPDGTLATEESILPLLRPPIRSEVATFSSAPRERIVPPVTRLMVLGRTTHLISPRSLQEPTPKP